MSNPRFRDRTYADWGAHRELAHESRDGVAYAPDTTNSVEEFLVEPWIASLRSQ